MLRIALDLEMNDTPDKSIIQIGACTFIVETGEIVSTFDTYIFQNEQISDYITKLTGITQDNVDLGYPIKEAYEMLLSYVNIIGVTKFPLVTWGAGDLPLLKVQVNNGIDWKLGRTEMNAKNLFQAWREANGKSTQGGLSRAMTNFGLNFIGRKHNAKDDAVNTARIYCELLKQFKVTKE